MSLRRRCQRRLSRRRRGGSGGESRHVRRRRRCGLRVAVRAAAGRGCAKRVSRTAGGVGARRSRQSACEDVLCQRRHTTRRTAVLALVDACLSATQWLHRCGQCGGGGGCGTGSRGAAGRGNWQGPRDRRTCACLHSTRRVWLRRHRRLESQKKKEEGEGVCGARCTARKKVACRHQLVAVIWPSLLVCPEYSAKAKMDTEKKLRNKSKMAM